MASNTFGGDNEYQSDRKSKQLIIEAENVTWLAAFFQNDKGRLN